MKINCIILASIALLASITTGYSAPDYVIASSEPSVTPSTATIIKKADYVVFSVEISGGGNSRDEKDLHNLITTATTVIKQSMASNKYIETEVVQIGSSLSAYMPKLFTDVAGVVSRIPVGNPAGCVAGVVGNLPVGNPAASSVVMERIENTCLQFLYRVTNENTNTDLITDQIRRILKSKDLPESLEYSLQSIDLAVINPDQYRKEIFSKVMDEVRDIKTVFGKNAIITLTGMESPVAVHYKDSITASLSIPYKLSVSLTK